MERDQKIALANMLTHVPDKIRAILLCEAVNEQIEKQIQTDEQKEQ